MANPYNELIETIREEGAFYNEAPFLFARITSVYPDIKIRFNDMTLDKNSLLMDKKLYDSISSLNVNDEVIVVPNGSKFIILSKVVSI